MLDSDRSTVQAVKSLPGMPDITTCQDAGNPIRWVARVLNDHSENERTGASLSSFSWRRWRTRGKLTPEPWPCVGKGRSERARLGLGLTARVQSALQTAISLCQSLHRVRNNTTMNRSRGQRNTEGVGESTVVAVRGLQAEAGHICPIVPAVPQYFITVRVAGNGAEVIRAS